MKDDFISTLNDILGNGNDDMPRITQKSKAEIEKFVRYFIDDQLVHFEYSHLYVYFKQLEYAINAALEDLKANAFGDIG